LGRHAPPLAAARRRLLAPGGALIPQRDTLWAAPVEAPDHYRRLVGVWEDSGYDFDLTAARRLVVNTWGKARVAPEQLLAEPRCWATLDYTTRDAPDVAARVERAPGRAGGARGLTVWFDTTLLDAVALSNAPGGPELIYGQAFFPFAEPLAVAPGDRMAAAVEARLVGDEYVWTWEAQLHDAAGGVKAARRQTSLAANPVTPAALRRRSADHVPVLDEEGEVDRFVLARMDGARTLAAIARAAAAAFPDRYPAWLDALPRGGELSQKDGKRKVTPLSLGQAAPP